MMHVVLLMTLMMIHYVSRLFMPLIEKLSLLRYLEEVKNEASEDIK